MDNKVISSVFFMGFARIVRCKLFFRGLSSLSFMVVHRMVLHPAPRALSFCLLGISLRASFILLPLSRNVTFDSF